METENLPIWCQRMMEIRINRSLSQAAVARVLKTTQTYYSQYEMNKRQIPFYRIVQLSKFYNIPIGYFAGEIDLVDILSKK